MPATLPPTAPSLPGPAHPAAGSPGGARRLLPPALLVVALLVAALVALLHARTLAWGPLEVADEALLEATSVAQAWWTAGPGGAALHLEGLGTAALPSRAVALVLALGTALLALALGARLGLARGEATLVALLFAAHPAQVEAVAWLSRRPEALGTFLFLLGAVLLLAGRAAAARAPTVLAGLALLAALLVDPRLGLLAPWLVLAARRTRPGGVRGVALGAAALLAIGLVLLGPAAWLPAPDAGARVLSAPAACLRLLALGAWPAGLTPTHPSPSGALAGGAAGIGGWVLLLGALALLARGAWRGSLAALGGVLALLGALAVTAVPAGAGAFREAEALPAVLGLALVVVAAARALPAGPLRLGAPALAVVALASRSELRIPDWRGESALREASLALRPDDGHARAALARWHFLHGRLSDAQVLLERVLEDDPESAQGHLGLGELELRRAQLPGAERRMALAVEHLSLATAIPRAEALLGEALLRMGRNPVAIEVLESATARLPYDALPASRLGMARLGLGDAPGASEAFARATELDPGLADAWTGLGLARLAAGEDGLAALERALALEPDHVEASTAVGAAREERGRLDEAALRYRRAVEVNPDHVDALFGLGNLLERTGETEEALRLLLRAAALRSDPPHVRASLGAARLLLARDGPGDVERARALLDAVLRFNPGQPEAQRLLRELPR